MFEPFRGTLFDPNVVADPGAATSPPYDVIDEEEQELLRRASPYNVVRLLLPEGGEERYQRAGAQLRSWLEGGVLRADRDRRFYLYQMRWIDHAGERVARGIIGALRLTELGDRVLPHEETMAGPRADRRAVLDATQASIDPIIALSASRELSTLLLPAGPPRVVAHADRVEHTLFDIPASASDPIGAQVSAHTVSIADGHHRYTTALAHAAPRGAGPWDSIMAMVAPAEGSGLEVAPYHRMFPGRVIDEDRLDETFVVEDADPLVPTEPGTIVLVDRSRAVLLRADPTALDRLPEPWREASSAVARELLYPLLGLDERHASYTPNRDAALRTAGEGGLAVLVAPVTERAIAAASETGLRFPQKTTFFTPKPRAGLVLRVFATA
jgi:uncharacterized protein (DUF1015 family)